MGSSGERVVHVRTVQRRAYRWPEIALSLLLFALLVCSCITLGTYSYFIYVQNRLFIAIPWYYYFLIATSILTLLFTIVCGVLYYIHLLLPLPILLVAFTLFVLWLTGLVKSSIELWGPLGSVNDNCVRYVYAEGFWGGKTLDTLARIQQEGMCNLWKTAFAMEMVASFCCLWVCLVAWQVMAAARGGLGY